MRVVLPVAGQVVILRMCACMENLPRSRSMHCRFPPAGARRDSAARLRRIPSVRRERGAAAGGAAACSANRPCCETMLDSACVELQQKRQRADQSSNEEAVQPGRRFCVAECSKLISDSKLGPLGQGKDFWAHAGHTRSHTMRSPCTQVVIVGSFSVRVESVLGEGGLATVYKVNACGHLLFASFYACHRESTRGAHR